MKIIGVAN